MQHPETEVILIFWHELHEKLTIKFKYDSICNRIKHKRTRPIWWIDALPGRPSLPNVIATHFLFMYPVLTFAAFCSLAMFPNIKILCPLAVPYWEPMTPNIWHFLFLYSLLMFPNATFLMFCCFLSISFEIWVIRNVD